MDAWHKQDWRLDIGANPVEMNSARFRVWAPYAKSVAVRLSDQDMVTVPMQPDGRGYFDATVRDVGSRARYRYVLDGVKERPDPASRFQPEGVYGPSVVLLHRWHTRGNGSLLICGFNRKPETILFAEPVGRWQRRLDVKSVECEGKKNVMWPEELVVDSRGLSLNVAPYSVALYMTQEQGRSV